MIFTLYSRNTIGTDGLTYALQRYGWAFRNHRGQPAPFDRDAVRRVIASWPKYAGLVVMGKLKDRGPEDIPLDWADSGRTLLPLPLLRRVAWVEHDRRKHRATGSVNQAHPYPMRGLLRCAPCAQRAAATDQALNPVRLTGTDKNGRRSYIHAAGKPCTCRVRSVRESVLNADVRRWLSAFSVIDDVSHLMSGLADEIAEFEVGRYEELEAERRVALRYQHRRLVALDTRFSNGTLKHPERYQVDRAAILATQKTLRQTVISRASAHVEMKNYVQQVRDPVQLWDRASAEDRQLLMALLVEYLDYDLDRQGSPYAIVSYKFQPWAAQFLKRS